MFIGDINKFGIHIEYISERNKPLIPLPKGILFLTINKRVFPEIICKTVLTTEVGWLLPKLKNITNNNSIFYMEKQEAYYKIYNMRFKNYSQHLQNIMEKNYDYEIITPELLKQNSIIFAVGNGKKTRFLGATVENNLKKFSQISTKETSEYNYEISETIISNEELKEVVDELQKIQNKIEKIK